MLFFNVLERIKQQKKIGSSPAFNLVTGCCWNNQRADSQMVSPHSTPDSLTPTHSWSCGVIKMQNQSLQSLQRQQHPVSNQFECSEEELQKQQNPCSQRKLSLLQLLPNFTGHRKIYFFPAPLSKCLSQYSSKPLLSELKLHIMQINHRKIIKIKISMHVFPSPWCLWSAFDQLVEPFHLHLHSNGHTWYCSPSNRHCR